MGFHLAPGLSFCDCAGERVFLDLPRDRYFALGRDADAAFTRLAGGEVLSGDDVERLAVLEQTGILIAHPTRVPPRPCPATLSSTAILDQPDLPAATTWSALRAAWLIKRAKARVRRFGLHHACSELVAAKAKLARADGVSRASAIAELAVAFQAAGRFINTLDECLARSLAAARRAVALGLDADLLLGVKVRPFQAHAWVEIGGAVVTDRLDVVRPYTPILCL